MQLTTHVRSLDILELHYKKYVHKLMCHKKSVRARPTLFP